MTFIRRIGIALGFTIFIGTAFAAALKPVTTVEGITEYRLSNGLQLLLAPDGSKPSTTVNMTYHVGSKAENYGETGMAHLLEHLLFKGSPKHKNPWAEFSKRGLRANGSTWLDRTNYFASFAANEESLKWYLKWQADAMVNSFIARRDLDTEMTVVRNEMEMGENNPGNITSERLLATMYQWHNYGKSTIGARADVENVDIPRLQSFYRNYYQPDNATLIVTGKFDPIKVLAWVQEGFGRIPAPKRKLPTQYTVDPVQDGERAVTVRRSGGVASAMAGYHVPAGPHPDYAAIELLGLVLTEPPSGRLHKQLVETAKLAASVGAFSMALAEPGFMILSADLAPRASMDDLSREMLAVIEGLETRPVTADELRRAQTRWLNGWEQQFADPEQVGTALSETISQGDWRLFFFLRDRVKAIKLDDLQRVARQFLIPSNRTMAHYIPTEKPLRAPSPALVKVAEQMRGFMPAAAQAQVAAFEATPTNIDRLTETVKLSNGMQIALLPKPTRGDTMNAQISLRWGDADSLRGKRQIAELTAALLDKGTVTLDRQQLRDALDALKIELQVMPGADSVSIFWTTKREHAVAAVQLIAEILRRPRLSPEALEELRSQYLTSLQAQRDEPEAMAANAMAQAFNSQPRGDVRHARSFDEIAADLQAVTAQQLREFHQGFYGAATGQVAAVGDFDADLMKKAIADAFGDWKSAAVYTRIPRPSLTLPGKQSLLRISDKQNAVLAARMPLALSDMHADYAALSMANYLLGGGGDSRLWKRIRETEGLSYSVGSYLAWSSIDLNSPWNISAIFAPQNRVKVEQALREEVARAIRDGFTAKELASGQQALLNQRRLARAQDAGLTASLANNIYLGRTQSRSQQVDQEIAGLSLEQVNKALRKYLLLDDFQLIFVGDFK